ncbi:MAG: hypothetical protein AAF404_02585 [Pseudomonadota bacterium]
MVPDLAYPVAATPPHIHFAAHGVSPEVAAVQSIKWFILLK